MKKNWNNYQLSRKELNRRLEDAYNEIFTAQEDKQMLIQQRNEQTQSYEEQKKENKNLKRLMKLFYLISLLNMDCLNICNEVENGWGFKSIIGTYLAGIAQELHKFGEGNLNPALYDPHEDDNDDFIDLSDYNEESET